MPFHDPSHPVRLLHGPSNPVRLLMVEDSPEDAELIVDQLALAGLHVETRRVESEADLDAALDEFAPHLILSDLSLPGYSGHDALAFVRRRSPATPFIYVSGTIGEEAAIEALKNGAADYILKQNTARLAAAVERALRDAQVERERRQAEAELIRAQRMESLALLTGGLGHDLRNVLQPLLIVPSIIRDHADKPQLLRLADLVHDCASRGLDMVGSMLSFARGDGEDHAEIEIDVLLGALRLMLQGSLPRRVELVVEGTGEGLVMKGNRTQIQQSMLNLALNGIQAMPDGGTLTISAELASADTLVLAVSDTGIGMDQATQDKLFTPFFTTKAEGTGLGLHSCRRIVEHHGGSIGVHSTSGKGTRFELHFPVAGSGDPCDEPLPRGNGERLLIVDEQAARAIRLSRTLEAHGYRTGVANDGASALQDIATSGAPDAVAVDAGLNLLSTVQTLGELERRHPDCPILVLYSPGARPERGDYPANLQLEFISRDSGLGEMLHALCTALAPAD